MGDDVTTYSPPPGSTIEVHTSEGWKRLGTIETSKEELEIMCPRSVIEKALCDFKKGE